MNYLSHPNLLTHFWTSVNAEFDGILNEFVRRDGWLFQDLGLVAKNANIGNIYNCASTTIHSSQVGKYERLDHFYRVILIILDAAKTQWLAPWRLYVEKFTDVVPPFLKRQIGGFFLLYMVYISQPLADRFQHKQKIIMDRKDVFSMHVFNATIKSLPKTGNDQFKELARQLVVLFNDLVKSEAFEFSIFNDVFITPSTGVRNLLSTKNCENMRALYSLKDVRDQLHYLTFHETPTVFRSLIRYGRIINPPPTEKAEEKTRPKTPEKPSKTTTDGTSATSESENDKNKTVFPPPDKEWTLEEIKKLENENDVGVIAHCLPGILKSLDIGPVLTRRRMTGCDELRLSREVSHCVQNYKSHAKLNKASSERRKLEQKPNLDHEKPISQTVWKEYFTDNYSWIDKIIKKEEPSSDTPANTSDHGGGIENFKVEHEDVEAEEEEDATLLENNSTLDESQREVFQSPTRKKLRVPMSMPSI